MGATYTRQSTYSDGDVITAAHTNDEFNQLLAAFASGTGHTHDGTSAEGGPITKLLGTAITIGDGTAGTDIAITFDGETNDGLITWMEDEDHFKFSDDVVIDSSKRLYFFDEGGEYIHGDGTDLNLVASADINIPANVGLTFGDDGEKIEGDGTDLTITGNNINLTATADVVLPSGVGLVLDGSGNEKIESDGTDISISVGSGGDINIPANIGLTFGDDGEKIEGDGTDLTISGNNINLTATADVNIPSGVGLTFATAEKIESDGTDLSITVGSGGDINIPADIGLTFGNDGEKIEGDGTDLTITGNNINLTASADVVLAANTGLVLDGSGDEKIESDGTDINFSVGANGDINIPANIGLTFGNDGEKIEGDGTDLTISANNLTVDADADIILDANGNNITFKANGSSILDIANSSDDVELTVSTADKNFAIKGTDGSSAITALDIDMALNGKATFSGDVVVTGDLTVTGDDITMGTNTSGHIMVADGANFNPVAVSGDVTISSAGAVTIANNAVETAMVNENVISGQSELGSSDVDITNDDLLIHDADAGALKKVSVTNLISSAGGLTEVVADSSPQLGGDLDTNGNNILIDDAHFIGDENGNEQIIFQTTSSAVNQFDVTNAATGNGPSITATGGDTNIDFNIAPKGTGQVVVDGNIVSGAYGSSSNPIIFNVTVASKSAHPYQGDGSSLAYYINGVESPALTLHGVDNVTSDSGYYYRFVLSSSDMSSHPFRFYLDADKTTAYTTNVTTTSTYTQIVVDEDTPSILYYQCSSHGYMGNYAIVLGSNKINHTEALISFPTTTGTLVGTGDTGTVSNDMLAGSIAASKLAGSIGDSKLSTISTADKVNIGALDIDGASDIGADLADADLIIVDDGAGGTEVKSELTRVKKYIYSAMSGDATASDAGAVTIANDAVESGMLNDNIISGQTELASGLASTDELLVSDAGTIKRMDVSVLQAVTDDSATALAIALG